MAISEARKRANKKWNDANMKERYDRIQLVVQKGKKELIRAHADSKGESVNAFINRAIDRLLEEEGVLAGDKDERKKVMEGDNSSIPVSGGLLRSIK